MKVNDVGSSVVVMEAERAKLADGLAIGCKRRETSKMGFDNSFSSFCVGWTSSYCIR